MQGEIFISSDEKEPINVCMDCASSDKLDDEDGFGMGGDWWKAAGESDDN